VNIVTTRAVGDKLVGLLVLLAHPFSSNKYENGTGAQSRVLSVGCSDTPSDICRQAQTSNFLHNGVLSVDSLTFKAQGTNILKEIAELLLVRIDCLVEGLDKGIRHTVRICHCVGGGSSFVKICKSRMRFVSKTVA